MERVMFNQTTVRYSQGICAFSCAGFTIGAVANKYLKSTYMDHMFLNLNQDRYVAHNLETCLIKAKTVTM
ncbi:hypothetical protein P5673_002825 [Acropora cervicornis]|uniref:Uncharacterized protein n=1 Tax=Acropora cervicornis TaxID=6130 RepID=A0AAD9R3P8_ACRCE|nr:hypothetical protein P5673_002825 [Acropora cervicornis]